MSCLPKNVNSQQPDIGDLHAPGAVCKAAGDRRGGLGSITVVCGLPGIQGPHACTQA